MRGKVGGGKLTDETFISLAEKWLLNQNMRGDPGRGDHHVLYLAFSGKEALAKDGKWDADSVEGFEAPSAEACKKLNAKIGSGGANITSYIRRGKLQRTV